MSRQTSIKHLAKWIIGAFFSTGVGLILLFLSYTGAFKPVQIEETKEGPYTLIYRSHLGPYHKIVTTLEEVETILKKEAIGCPFTFGRFLDNPETIEEDRLRSDVGCLFTKTLTLENHAKMVALLEANHLRMEEWSVERAVKATFHGAPSVGPMKVYPKVKEYMLEKGYKESGPILEVYELLPQRGVLTRYYFPYTR